MYRSYRKRSTHKNPPAPSCQRLQSRLGCHGRLAIIKRQDGLSAGLRRPRDVELSVLSLTSCSIYLCPSVRPSASLFYLSLSISLSLSLYLSIDMLICPVLALSGDVACYWAVAQNEKKPSGEFQVLGLPISQGWLAILGYPRPSSWPLKVCSLAMGC